MSSNQDRCQYDRDFKIEAGRLSWEAGRTVTWVARDLEAGIGASRAICHPQEAKTKIFEYIEVFYN